MYLLTSILSGNKGKSAFSRSTEAKSDRYLYAREGIGTEVTEICGFVLLFPHSLSSGAQIREYLARTSMEVMHGRCGTRNHAVQKHSNSVTVNREI